MKYTFTGILFVLVFSLFAQVPKTVVVEHFTNTLCSTCANRNPGLFTNLNNNSDVVHLAFHPSSPYSQCVFNQHDVTANDGRTSYYGIYGSTPRIVVQGSVIPATVNYGDASIFMNQTGQMSPFSVRIEVGTPNGNGAFTVEVVVKTEATHNYTNLKLFAAIAEDTIFYNAPNGETKHYNVFRKSVFEIDGKSITPAIAIGDSVVFTETLNFNPIWQTAHLEGIAILQEVGNKAVVQAATSKNQIFTTTVNISEAPFKLYSANDQIFFQSDEVGNYQVQVLDLQGKLLRQFNSNGNDIWFFEELKTGVYLVRINTENKVWAKLLPIFR